MTDETANIVPEHLRSIRATLDRHSQAFANINLRLSGIEQHRAGFQTREIRQNSELDRIKERLDRIERRLELADGE